MNTLLKKLSCLALLWALFLAITMPAYSLTIIPTFDTSITNDPNGPAMVKAITNAINVFQTKIADHQTVKVDFNNDPSAGLGENSTFYITVPYSSYLSALRSHATSANDTLALSKIPNTSTDPVTGGNQINVQLPLAILLGLYSYNGSESTIILNASIMNFTRPPANPNKYDMQQVVEHEMDEVLGTPSSVGDGPYISPMDLFRYTTNLVRTFTTSGDNSYFSIDGTNLLARFNMTGGGSDYGDWWSKTANWASPGMMPHVQVQDAFTPPNTQVDLGPNELTALDVIGWTLVVATPTTPPVLKIVRTGAGQYTLSWTNTATGYSLQERTNLITGAWLASFTGATNPAVITSTNTQKFYRLANASVSSQVISPPAAANQPAVTAPLPVKVGIAHPR